MCGAGRFDGIAFVGYVHCLDLVFLWVEVHEP